MLGRQSQATCERQAHEEDILLPFGGYVLLMFFHVDLKDITSPHLLAGCASEIA